MVICISPLTGQVVDHYMRCDQLQRVCDAVRVTDDLIAMPHTPSLPSCPVDPHSGRMHNVSFSTFLTAVSILIDYGWRSKAPFRRFFFETNRVISLHFFPVRDWRRFPLWSFISSFPLRVLRGHFGIFLKNGQPCSCLSNFIQGNTCYTCSTKFSVLVVHFKSNRVW